LDHKKLAHVSGANTAVVLSKALTGFGKLEMVYQARMLHSRRSADIEAACATFCLGNMQNQPHLEAIEVVKVLGGVKR
jgi:hypothetical protein